VTNRRTLCRILALFCAAAILLLSLTQPGLGLPIALLAPFWMVLAVLLPLAFRLEGAAEILCPAPCLAVLPARAPPAR
jgi:hypothetical protein